MLRSIARRFVRLPFVHRGHLLVAFLRRWRVGKNGLVRKEVLSNLLEDILTGEIVRRLLLMRPAQIRRLLEAVRSGWFGVARRRSVLGIDQREKLLTELVESRQREDVIVSVVIGSGFDTE